MVEVIALFPTPFMRVAGALDGALVRGLVEHFSGRAVRENNSSDHLSHTEMLRPSDSPLFVQAAALITPRLVEFGALMFGERLGWSLKEMWVNVLDTGGRQAMHNHANSFISGVVYLTPTHPSAQTVFMSRPGHRLRVQERPCRHQPGPVQRRQWISPAPAPGDLVLFPAT